MVSSQLALIKGDEMSFEENAFRKFLSYLVPDIAIIDYQLTYEAIKRHRPLGWPSDDLSSLVRYPVIMHAPLGNPVGDSVSPEKVLSHCINAHTCIQLFYAPKKFRFFVVSRTEFPSVTLEGCEYLNHDETGSLYIARELTRAHSPSCLYEVDASSSHLESSVKHIRLSSSQFIKKVLEAPESLQVIYTSPPYATFIRDLIQSTYASWAMTSITIGPSNLIFSFQPECLYPSMVLATSLFLRYLGYTQTARQLEQALAVHWEDLLSHDFSWVDNQDLLAPRDKDLVWLQVAQHYHDLSFLKESITGFDVFMVPTLSVQELGSTLEELTSSYPFCLGGISYRGLQIYPLVLSIPSIFDALWQCRFLMPQGKLLHNKDISLFITQLSALYPWSHISLLYKKR